MFHVEHSIAVNDAWRLAPSADVLYANESNWWDASGPTAEQFSGERWSSHSECKRITDDKKACASKHGLNLIAGASEPGFCFEPGQIHYGDNSGFQAINLALQFGAKKIWLIGFDMSHTGKRHFFGDHPPACHKDSNYQNYIHYFDTAAEMLPAGIDIINATRGSALTCFRSATL